METPAITNLAGDKTQMHSKQFQQQAATTSTATASSTIQQQSPRNTSTSSSTMSSGTYVQVGPIEVSKSLQDGDKFVKWDEVSFFSVIFLCIFFIY